MMRCLITGGNGFFGRTLISHVLTKGYDVRSPLRQPPRADQIFGFETVDIGSLSLEDDWTAALRGVDRIVHLAAHVNLMNDKRTDPLAEFRRVNAKVRTASYVRRQRLAFVGLFT